MCIRDRSNFHGRFQRFFHPLLHAHWTSSSRPRIRRRICRRILILRRRRRGVSRPFVARKIRRYRRRVPAPGRLFLVPFRFRSSSRRRRRRRRFLLLPLFHFWRRVHARHPPFSSPLLLLFFPSPFGRIVGLFRLFFWCVQHHVVLLDIVAVVERL